jgi:acetyltransferase-like isoleucine patch superfamily enzyme
MNNSFAPVLIFGYNRPQHLKKCINALLNSRNADNTEVFIFLDGPKDNASTIQLNLHFEVKNCVSSISGFKSIRTIESSTNLGLSKSIVNGINAIFEKYDRIIVLEDDVIVSEGFLDYCNSALECYQNDNEVMHISAANYALDIPPECETFFAKILTCHGWATWRRAWKHFNDDAIDHLAYFNSSPERVLDFDVNGKAYFLEQLKQNVEGRISTWAVKWYASWLRAGGISLLPRMSLVGNIGFDGSGENSGYAESYLSARVETISVVRQPIIENTEYRERLSVFWSKYLENNWRNLSTRGGQIIEKKDVIFKIALLKVFRKIFRRLLLMLFPEFKSLFFAEDRVNWDSVIQNTYRSNVSENCKIYIPSITHYSSIGDYTYISRNARISYTEIGKFCSIGPNFVCGWGIHPINGVSTAPMFYSLNCQNGTTLSNTDKISERNKITIGNDVFIGANVTVLDGVTIGDGAVVGAGCVVSKDVPPYSVVVGSPMQVLRYRFDEKIISRLLNLRWWDSNTEVLQALERNFFSVEEFLDEIEYKNGK